ncbi:tash protein pest motif family protein [Burkholderia pseudomallei]|nr:tash protein pest motif family protein [Burkholderia pseudomallei]CAK0374235.1 tash protein pest motif family protein [Burkholderia pseudomallei]
MPSVPAATFVIWRCCVSLPTDTTFERPPSFEPAPSATEFEPAVTDGEVAFGALMSAATPVLAGSDRITLFVIDVDSDATLLLVVARPVDSEPMPVEVDVDSDARLLFAVERPVDSEPMLVEVDVDSEATVLLVVDRPVDSEPTAVEVDVDSDARLLLVAFRPVDSDATLLLVA